MRFALWLVIGLALGPSFLNATAPTWYGVATQVSGALFLFLAGWELRFLDLKKDAKFYVLCFIGAFIVPVICGYVLLGQHAFLALAMGISALPVAVQILKEKNLYHTVLARQAITVASICDIAAWLLLAAILPKEDVESWIVSHWMIFTFFIGLVLGRFYEPKITKKIEILHMWILAPVFFIGLGWKVDLLGLFQWKVFLLILVVAVLSKFIGTYLFARLSGQEVKHSKNLAVLLNARGAMEVLAAHFAYNAGLIDGAGFAALVCLGLVTSLMAFPLIKE